MDTSTSRPKFHTRPWTIDGMIVGEVQSGIYTKYVKIEPGDIVADVGAHIGVFSVTASRIASQVYAFEPQPENYKLLLENIEINKAENVAPINMAVADGEGESFLQFDPLNTGGHSLTDTPHSTGWRVQTTTLDHTLPKVDFIKLDAEGSEIKVLRGADYLLRTYNVKIAAEIHARPNLNQAVNLLVDQYRYTVGWEPYGLADLYLLWAWKEQL